MNIKTISKVVKLTSLLKNLKIDYLSEDGDYICLTSHEPNGLVTLDISEYDNHIRFTLERVTFFNGKVDTRVELYNHNVTTEKMENMEYPEIMDRAFGIERLTH